MEKLWCADNLDGTYRNPVIFSDYSDPDVIGVGDNFYMTASSFNYIPGLPILVSKDLVNWELKNYALKKIDYKEYEIPQHAKGVWAPSIRSHEGRFYIYYGMPDEGIFMVSTLDPLGEWDEPVLVLEGKGLIDPCPFWDKDGRAYVVHGYAKSRIGFKSALGIFEMSTDGKKAISEDHILYDGRDSQPTIEGPKVYEREGFIYIFAPAGGVKTGWQTVLRSKSIQGPFEEKIVLEQKDTKINGPHQGAYVETVDGAGWFLHFQDRGMYGRIAHLQPVVWEGGWPVMGDNGKPVLVHEKPYCIQNVEALSLEASDDFDGEELKLIWQWTGNGQDEFYSLTENKNHLRLYALNPSGDETPILWRSANLLTEKLVCPYFEAQIALNVDGLVDGDKAGIAMIGGEYAYLAVRKIGEEFDLVYGISHELNGVIPNGPGCKIEDEIIIKSLEKDEIENLVLGIQLKEFEGKPKFNYYYKCKESCVMVEKSESFLPSDHTWVGAKIGLFAIGTKDGYADFDYIHVSNK